VLGGRGGGHQTWGYHGGGEGAAQEPIPSSFFSQP
jgi:hypothetical protein